jgi:hypothetical protein
VMMSLGPDATEDVGIFEKRVVSTAACADGQVSIGGVSGGGGASIRSRARRSAGPQRRGDRSSCRFPQNIK